MKDSQSYKNAFLISLIYFIFGTLWIAVSDNTVAHIAINQDELTLLQNYKGWLFIVTTTIFLYALTYHFFKAGFLLYHKQMTLQKEHEKEISKHNNLIRAIVDNSPDAIYAKDTQGRYILFNNSSASAVGVPREEVIGNSDSLIFTDKVASKIKEADKKILKTKSIQTKEDEITTINGVTKTFLETKGPLFTEDGEIFGLFGISRDITEQKEHEKYLIDSKQEQYILAHQDRLTKLPNRLHMTEHIDEKYVKNRPFSLILLGLDGFKVINDSYGHKFGDRLIINVVKLLQDVFDTDSFIAHIGGDEFGIVLDSDDKEYIETLMQRLKEKFNTPFVINETDVYITASLGIATCNLAEKSLDNLLQQADSAMYNAKKMGKNRYSFYDEKFIQEALIHTQIVTNLQKALQNNQLELYYQSQNDPFSEKIVGFEALLRWKLEDTMIPPNVFIPIAEETGMIIEIGHLVLEKGCQTATLWRQKGVLSGKVAINISPKQLSHPAFLDNLDSTIKKTKCHPEWIELEITESSLMQNPAQAILLLQEIKKRGFSISMDDFGTGYSSLSYIKDLPIDKLKIDQSFIRNIKNDSKNQTIVKTTIALAKGLSIAVLAEGVETLDELEFLKTEGIDSVQGYYYTRPMPLGEMEELLKKLQ